MNSMHARSGAQLIKVISAMALVILVQEPVFWLFVFGGIALFGAVYIVCDFINKTKEKQ